MKTFLVTIGEYYKNEYHPSCWEVYPSTQSIYRVEAYKL